MQQGSLVVMAEQPLFPFLNFLTQLAMMSYSLVPPSSDGSMSRLKAAPCTSAQCRGTRSHSMCVCHCPLPPAVRLMTWKRQRRRQQHSSQYQIGMCDEGCS